MKIALPELMRCPGAWHTLILKGKVVGADLVVADEVALPVLASCEEPVTYAATPAPLFTPDLVASPELQAERRAICDACEFNQQGVCRQCCGGVPVVTLVRLTASRCQRGKWRA